MGLLSLPRVLGTHPETGGKIQANLGRFGPFVVHTMAPQEQEYRSLKKEDDVLTIDLQRALELLAEPKRGKGASRTKAPLKELGLHPEDQEPVNVYQGPYGIYVKHGKVNAGLPEGETIENLTLETALVLLAAKTNRKGKKTSGKTIASQSTSEAKTTRKSTKATPGVEDSSNGSASTSTKGTTKTAAKSTKATRSPSKTASKTTAKTTTKKSGTGSSRSSKSHGEV